MTRGSLLESVVLPWLLLTVALIAGMRMTDAGELRFLMPPLASLVAMLLLMMVLVRSGVVLPWLLMNERRTPLENLSGVVLLASLAAASAQIVSAVTPEAGLPLVLGVVFLFALFGNTLAARPARQPALRALFVAFFAAFTVKFIVLDALYAPDRSLGGRLLTGLIEGITLGSFDHVVWAPATGYLTFVALVIYFLALAMMPRPAATTAESLARI
ncbi:MAG: hypothetical protein M3R55_06040 [Acidobacteriota bacterium]|nr:hypothetical protein [Acidobacteriota bacterium]